MRVAVIDGPHGFVEQLTDAVVAPRLAGRFALIVFFAMSRRSLHKRLPALLRARDEGGGLWVAWPKQTAGVSTDLDDTVVREAVLATDLVDNKVCAIDATWSALRFVARRSAT
jgi:hypothetical protein